MNQMITEPAAFLPAALDLAQTAPAAHAATISDFARAHVLLQGWAQRAAINGADTTKLLASGMLFVFAGELLDMQRATYERFIKQQGATLEDWVEWGHQRAQLRGANTMTKLMEQEMNLVGRIGQIFTDQLTNLMALQENVEIAYGFWLSQKLGGASTSRVAAAAWSGQAQAV
ncbi:hypothetical protein G3N59_24800 [Paraburkholderia sp. Ac-20340]|uniref:hypothetical protein n=1 Tax=Paraburkholderia sp. Ac-20340 TaxID=2703888 RepID=UPI00198196C4|nr:hypothetical protein [Paraburkholderia sp. Ac-20340]MBN3856606.1 hypothetical protein [Paraburkholderia sp. Ac-20340]